MALSTHPIFDLAGMLDTASRLCDAVAGFDPAVCSGADAAQVVSTLARVERVCSAARVRAALRVEACGAYRQAGHRGAAEFVAAELGTSPQSAAASMDAAATLNGAPALRDAFARGELSETQATTVAPAVAANPAAADELLETARTGTLRQLRDKARRVRLATMDREELHAKQVRLREHRHWVDDDGMVAGRYRLPPEVGAPFIAQIDRETDRIFRSRSKEERESPLAYAADALVNLVNLGVTGQGGVDVGGHGAGSGGSGGRRRRKQTRRSPKVDAVLVVDLPVILSGHIQPGERCHILGVGPVSVSVARQMLANAFIKVAVLDGVEIRKIKHLKRYREAELQTALDLGPLPDLNGVECVDAGCDRRMGLQWDHDDPLANGGPTWVGNLKPRCGSHHHEKTERDRAAGLLGNARRKPPADEQGSDPP